MAFPALEFSSPFERYPCHLCTWTLWWSSSACPPPHSRSCPLQIFSADCHSILPAAQRQQAGNDLVKTMCVQECGGCVWGWTHQFWGFTDGLGFSKVHDWCQSLRETSNDQNETFSPAVLLQHRHLFESFYFLLLLDPVRGLLQHSL